MDKKWLKIKEAYKGSNGAIMRFLTDDNGCYEWHLEEDKLLVLDCYIYLSALGEEIKGIKYTIEQEYTEVEVDLSRIEKNEVCFVGKNKEGGVVNDIREAKMHKIYRLYDL